MNKVVKMQDCATCRECWYWVPRIGEGDGACHAHPPLVMSDGEDNLYFTRPLTDPDDRSCTFFEGRHKA